MEKRIDLLRKGFRFLAREGLDNARGEAEIFLSHIFNCPRIALYLDNKPIEEKDSGDYWSLLRQRAKGIPLQYLIGHVEFMGLTFKVAPGVFIPRPETEILVETVLNIVSRLATEAPNRQSDKLNILDIGTGCGNIAISIAKGLEKACPLARQAHIFACDISDSALQLVKENCRLNKVGINIIKSNLFSAFKRKNYFSLIVSNPPYIKRELIRGLSPELHYEPRGAIDAGSDGLFYYREISREAADYLKDKGILVLEIGDSQGPSVKEILTQKRRFSILEVIRDYNDTERVIVAEKQR